MKEKVLKYIKENNMLLSGESVVVGVSGGSDSMCLFNILWELQSLLKIKLIVVHINHGLRGKAADLDMEFVENFCKDKGILYYSFKFDIKKEADKRKMSTEEAGRLIRYEKFNEIAEKYDAKIAVAHNMNDNAETVLFNMLRGTGLKGMMGIPPKRDRIIRPVMCLSKEEIYSYLDKKHIKYRVDESNFEEEYTRNKIRLKLLPYIKDNINEKAVEHINEMSNDMGEIFEYIQETAGDIFDKNVIKYSDDFGNGLIISNSVFELKHLLVSEVIRKCIYENTGKLKDITRGHIEDIIALKEKQVGAGVSLPYGLTAKKRYEGVLIFSGKNQDSKDIKADNMINEELTISGYGVYEFKGRNGKITISKGEFSDEIFMENMYTKWINCDILKNSLSLRTRRTGDYIIVDNKGSKKKLKDFFIDSKIPREKRDSILLLTNGNEVIWIIGYRLSAAYKVDKDCSNIVKVDFTG